MVFSLKKNSQSNTNSILNSNGETQDSNEISQRSNRTKKKKKKSHNLLNQIQQITSNAYDNETYIRSSASENAIIYKNRCPCDTHYSKQLLEHNYDLSINKLFDLIFGSNQFVQEFRKAQRFFDHTETEWTLNEATNHRERTLRYKVPYESTFFGRGTILTREKQTIFHEETDSFYVLETEVYNEGIHYCDTFSLIIRYCLVQTSITTTNLRVTACIIYNKTNNRFLKQMIELNAYSASQNGLKDLNNRLNQMAKFKTEKRRLSDDGILITVPSKENIPCKIETDFQSVSKLTIENNRNVENLYSNRLMIILIILITILFIMHIYLYMRLKNMDHVLEKLSQMTKI